MQFIQKITFLALIFSFSAFTNLKASNEPIIEVHPTNLSLVSGSKAELNVKVTANLKVVYQWQKSTDNLTWFDIKGAIQAAYAPQTVETGKAFYRVLITTVEENARAVDSKSAEVTVRDTTQSAFSTKK